MTPSQQAAAVYQCEPCARSFAEDLEAHLIHGYVVNTPTAFIMARYVGRWWSRERIVDPWSNGEDGEQLDCLHIYLAAGNLREFFTFPHHHAMWISFERANVLRFHPYAILKRLCSSNSTDLISRLT